MQRGRRAAGPCPRTFDSLEAQGQANLDKHMLGGMGQSGTEGEGKDQTQQRDHGHGNHLFHRKSALSSLPTPKCLSDCVSQCLVWDRGYQTHGWLPPTHSCSDPMPD